MIEPIVIEFSVTCSAAHAFHMWTAGIDRWWPADHTVSGDPTAEIVLEPRRGGRIFEREADGTEHDWGEVRRYDPPTEIVYWWHLGSGRSLATEVRVTFSPTPAGTTVCIEHRGWEQLGVDRQQRRDANLAGWTDLLPQFESALDAVEHDPTP